ncbi:hypothetical protein Q669_14990 [Labrenzia sp. C1B10]|nr:hypothetical protein Q669_14990 [Labrenzia sp. C1B10]ERS06618.1 hypothetical protein Q675_25550 [Labrenzia sp. C1B70]
MPAHGMAAPGHFLPSAPPAPGEFCLGTAADFVRCDQQPASIQQEKSAVFAKTGTGTEVAEQPAARFGAFWNLLK